MTGASLAYAPSVVPGIKDIVSDVVARILDRFAMGSEDEIWTFENIDLGDYQKIMERISEGEGGPRISYIRSERVIIVEWPSGVREVPMQYFSQALQGFRKFRSSGALNVTIHTNTDVGDASRGIYFTPHCHLRAHRNKDSKLEYLLIAECAYTQNMRQLHSKLQGLLEARPEIIMVVIVDIQGSPYKAPRHLGETWQYFNPVQEMWDQRKFIEHARNQGHRTFEDQIIVGKHTWGSITGMKYQVWLSAQTGGAIDLAKQDNYAEGDFPGNMLNVVSKMNEGFDLIKKQLINLYPNRDLDMLRKESILFPSNSYDDIADDVLAAIECLAYTRFSLWYQDNFRGEKRSSSTDAEELVEPTAQRPRLDRTGTS